MSKTNVILHNMPVSTTLVIGQITYRENLGKIALELDEGTHIGTITFAGNSSDIKLVVPKSNADKVQEQVQAQVDAAVAAATQGMKTQADIDAAVATAVATAVAGLKTPEQVAAEVQTALDNVVEAAQGYVKIDRLEEETNYKDGQHFNETTTKLKLIYSIDKTKTPVATKVKVHMSDDTVATHDVPDGFFSSEYVYAEIAAGGMAIPVITKIEVLAGNNKVIDELNLGNLFSKGAVPECPAVKYSIAFIRVENNSVSIRHSEQVTDVKVDLIDTTNGSVLQTQQTNATDPTFLTTFTNVDWSDSKVIKYHAKDGFADTSIKIDRRS